MINNTLSNVDIDEILKNYKIKYNGIFSKDELPNKLIDGFDAFGFPAPTKIINLLHAYDYYHKDI